MTSKLYFLTTVFCAFSVLFLQDASAQRKTPEQLIKEEADRKQEREELSRFEIQTRLKYESRPLVAKAVSLLVGKVEASLVKRIQLAKDLNSGNISKEFTAEFSINPVADALEAKVQKTDFSVINELVNVEPQLKSTLMGLGKSIVVPNTISATESVTTHILFPTLSGGRRANLTDRVKHSQWAEPTASGVRVCRFVGGTNGIGDCYEVLANQSIRYHILAPAVVGSKMQVYPPKVAVNLSSAQDVLNHRESYVIDNIISVGRLDKIITVLERKSQRVALLPSEAQELNDLLAKRAKLSAKKR